MERMKPSARRSPAPALADRIVGHLEREILAGRLCAGEKLPTEEELGTFHGASRAAVREALQMLKARGLVVSRRGSGSFVAENTWEQPLQRSLERYAALRGDARAFHELLDLRVLVETFCIRRLMRPGAEMQRERLADCLVRMEAERANLRRFGSADLAFHHEIVHGAGNELMTTIYRGLIPKLGERFARATYTDLELTDRTLRDHREIFSAVKSGDESLAVAKLVAHLEWSRRHMEEVVSPPVPVQKPGARGRGRAKPA